MGTLEFRPPQFSEDLAWAPAWVQHQVQQFDECIKEPLGSLKLASKDLTSFQGNICDEHDEILLSREGGRHNRYYLFASGEDNSSMSSTSCHGNVLQFNLHLSSDGCAQCVPSQVLALDASQVVSELIPSVKQFENPIALKEDARSKMSCNSGGLDVLHRNANPELCSQYPDNSKDSLRHYGEFNVRHLKDTEINDAVKLSIAASEALAIHEIANKKSGLEEVVATDLLEVALRVKQARLEWIEDAFDCSTTETDEHDSLSDLDDFAMTDAYEDVGLTCDTYDVHVNGSAISLVKETPASENYYKHENHSGSIELWAQQVNFDGIATQKQFENNLNLDAIQRLDSPLESLNYERQKKIFDGSVPISSIATMASKNDSSTPKIPCGVDVQMDGSSMVDLTSPHPQTKDRVATHGSKLEVARGDRVAYLVSERFRSRWLGGWTIEKEVDASARPEQNNAKGIMKAFTVETSFLSESADFAPDENSLVQIRGIKSLRESQSSIGCEGLLDKADRGILISQDMVKSSSLSLVDPLCSVVPCSISLEDTKSIEVQNQNNMETDSERHFGPTEELEIGNSCHLSGLNVEFHCRKGQVMDIVNEGSRGIVRRQLTSLKTYSRLLPKNDSASVSHCFAGKENEENCKTMLNGSANEKLKRQKKICHKTAGDGKMQSLLLDCNATHPLQASRPSIINSCGEEHPKKAPQPEDVIKFQQSKRLQKIQSDYKNSPDKIFPARKRVRFSEADVLIKPNENVQELHFSKRNCSTMGARKKLKYIDIWSHHHSEKGFLGCCSQIGKGLIFQSIRFLLTGFSSQKAKDIRQQIQNHGGIILSDIPSPPNSRRKWWSRSNWFQLPVILSSKKQQTTKFLYGCAATALILKGDWINDSVQAGHILAPEKYMILPWQDVESSIQKQDHYDNSNSIFNKVGIMLHGKRNFCTKLSKIVKHGGGRVFKTLHWLVHSLDKKHIDVGAIVTEDENMASRHLRQCALERQIPVMPASWIIKSLHSGKLLPFEE